MANNSTSMNATSLNFQYEPRTGSIIPHLLLFIIQMTALGGPIFPGRRLIFSIAIIYLAISANLNQFSSDPGLSQFFSLAWPHYLCILSNLLFYGSRGPEADLWRIDKSKGEALSYPAFSLAKLKWALVVWFNLRGIRWNFQVKNVPKGPKPGEFTRTGFVLQQLVKLVRTLLIVDLVSQLTIRAFWTAPDGTVGSMDSKYVTARDPDWRLSFYKTLLMSFGPFFFMLSEYVFGAIISVALGWSKPEDWPNFFGCVSEVTTIRIFWGKFWHQMLRRTVNNITGAFIDMTGINHGTNLSSYTQLWLSFAISGFMHAVSITLIPAPLNIPLVDRSPGFLVFFLLQAASITFEDFIQWAWRNLFPRTGGKNNRWCKYIGYMWVICWFWFSLPFATDILLRLKVGQDPILPFTLFGKFLK